MDLIGFLLTFTMLWKLSSSLQCYSCETCPVNFNSTIRDNYLKHCEYSTMCYKKVSKLELGNGLSSHNTQRGCASQTLDGEQRKINKTWTEVHDIHEVYEEGCIEDPSNGVRTTNTILCYCRGDKCNGAENTRSFMGLFVMNIAMLVFS